MKVDCEKRRNAYIFLKFSKFMQIRTRKGADNFRIRMPLQRRGQFGEKDIKY